MKIYKYSIRSGVFTYNGYTLALTEEDAMNRLREHYGDQIFFYGVDESLVIETK